MDAASTSSASLKKRVKHTKVRTGCLTCKIRRVKCDETRPACLRCTKFDGQCDGYSTSKAKQNLTPRHETQNPAPFMQPRPLLPRSGKEDRTSFVPTLYRPVHVAKFRNEQEHLGFLSFRNPTISELSSLFPSSLWERVILQACQEETYVRDAVIAVGALFSCERRLVFDTENRKSWGGIENAPRYQFALQHYGNTIKTMRQQLPSMRGDQSLRTMLIGCILIVCFEAMQGNYVQSVTHAVGGHGVLQSWLTSKRRSNSPFFTKEWLTCPATSPAEDVVEDELVQAFARIDLQIMQYSLDPRGMEDHLLLGYEGSEAIRNMPLQFASIGEARSYLILVDRRTWHFLSSFALSQYEKRGREEDIDVSKHTDLNDVLSKDNNRAQIWQAESAAHPIYRTLPRNSREWKAASLLQIQAQTTRIYLHGWLRSDESWSDQFLPEFQWIVNRGKEIFDDDLIQNKHRFSFDGGFIHPLQTIGHYCREPNVRREAIALLRRIAAKELFWDGLMHASACEAQMKFEEEGMDIHGFIPESHRFQIRGGKVDMLNRIGTIIYRRMGRNEDGTLDERDSAFHYEYPFQSPAKGHCSMGSSAWQTMLLQYVQAMFV
ncbi:uncharacterized protein LY89DRAFT_781684 [Mollisia scopiformis]|uniref:Zn(2)-C6 fungal-type domain-containing protein n=1 Tax=Mollisia scopiformis TaxID=149040 RepID=A0A194XBD9_MOLSC|nr:uncharacterized protein LY89DRAFT_781684 [Mollisia scopiformis]KUJ17486.1 hypothetical protein LY89DRAFT_781684 [Mollisia scopiformis]